MSTQSTAKEQELTAADFAAILSTTLAMAAEVGLPVGVANADGALLVRIGGLAVADGALVEAYELRNEPDQR
jgi:hypothetical protein